MLHIFTGSLAFFKITAYLFSKCSTKYHKLAVCVLQESPTHNYEKDFKKPLTFCVHLYEEHKPFAFLL